MSNVIWTVVLSVLGLALAFGIMYWMFVASLSSAGTVSRQMRDETLSQCPNCNGLALSRQLRGEVTCPHCNTLYTLPL